MADDADRAGPRIEQVVADGIQKARFDVGLKVTGVCYYCNESMTIPRLFCCTDCRDDWHWEQARKRANSE